MEGLTEEAISGHASLLRGFANDCKLRGTTGKSIRRYMSSVRIFLKFLKDKLCGLILLV